MSDTQWMRGLHRLEDFVKPGFYKGAQAFEQAHATVLGPKARSAAKAAFGEIRVPAPALARPVLLVPGLTMLSRSFGNLTGHLGQRPENGRLVIVNQRDGRLHWDDARGPIIDEVREADALRASRMFAIEYFNTHGEPSEKAPQVAKAVETIRRVTGAPLLDVVAHSAGCTDVRKFLDDRAGRSAGGKASAIFENAVFVGPADEGTFMGNIGAKMGAPLGVQRAGQELAEGSKSIITLNDRWERQRAQVNGRVTQIAISGAPTLTKASGTLEVLDGDGYMTVKSIPREATDTFVIEGPGRTPLAHLMEIFYATTIERICLALTPPRDGGSTFESAVR